MSSKRLRGGLGRNLAGLVLGSTVAVGMSGCESMSEGEVFGAGLSALAANNPGYKNSDVLNIFGGAVYNSSKATEQNRSNIEAARQGRDVNVYTGRRDSRVSGPTGEIQDIWTNHNVFENEEKGMRIHLKFNIKNHRMERARVSIYFHERNGDKLKDSDGEYRTRNGQVNVSRDLTPSYDNAIYNDFILFMPYKQLDLSRSGKHRLKFDVLIWDRTTNPATRICESDAWFNFKYNKN